MSNDISTGAGGSYAPPLQNTPDVKTDTTDVKTEGKTEVKTGSAKETPAPDVAKLLAELQKQLATFKANASGGTGGTKGVNDANGAPEISAPTSLSIEDLTLMLTDLSNKTKEGRLNAAKGDLQYNQTKLEENSKAAQDKINEWANKTHEAAEAEKTQAILAWVGVGVGLLAAVVGAIVAVVAVVVTVCTAGAAAPLMIAATIGAVVAVAGLVGAIIGMASQISQSCGGPPIELSSLLKWGMTEMFKAMGLPEEKAKALGEFTSGSLGILCTGGAILLVDQGFAGQVAGGFLASVGVDPATAGWVAMGVTLATTVIIGVAVAVITLGASVGATVSTMAKGAGSLAKLGTDISTKLATEGIKAGVKVANEALKAGMATVSIATKTSRIISAVVQVVVGLLQGSMKVTQGSLGIAKGVSEIDEAKIVREGAQAQIDKKMIDALMVSLTAMMDQSTDEMKKLMQQIEEALSNIGSMIAGNAQTNSQLTQNIASKPMMM